MPFFRLDALDVRDALSRHATRTFPLALAVSGRVSAMEKTVQNGQNPSKTNIRVDQSGAVVILGIWAWLFTIGYLHLSFWKEVLEILLWPYYLGSTFGTPH